jgi:Na+/proline symporter
VLGFAEVLLPLDPDLAADAVNFSRIARALPAITSALSPRIRKAVMNAAIWAAVASPSMISLSAACASSCDSGRSSASLAMASRIMVETFRVRLPRQDCLMTHGS